MKIDTKFSCGDTCYYMEDNRIHSGAIVSIKIDICNSGVSVDYEIEPHSLPRTHFNRYEHQLYKTIDECVEDLKDNVV